MKYKVFYALTAEIEAEVEAKSFEEALAAPFNVKNVKAEKWLDGPHPVRAIDKNGERREKEEAK